MAFDKATRNSLASFVGKSRNLIADEFTQMFHSLYGISVNGDITPIDKLTHLDDNGLATAVLLRERIEYLIKTHPDDKDGSKTAVERLAREQAFTILNRLAAICMAEKRGLIVESVGKSYQSKGFKVFEQVAGTGLGDIYHRYCRYLFCLFDELAVDLGSLFDRRSPQSLLFPRETALLELISLINSHEIETLWIEDETIGWIYQYYNDPAERKRMRDESSAPRNSRELAVRNQFFTPRYVVEFLTDNTLGRIWYEMTQGETGLKDTIQYLVRRPNEIFLKPDELAPDNANEDENLSQEELLKQPVYIPYRPIKDPRILRMLDPACGSMHFGLYSFDLYERIYNEAWDIEQQMGMAALVRDTGLKPLTQTYIDKDAFLRDVPRLIIEHNIHGIDIDPRAVQIAGLSLWLRAQRSWYNQSVKAADRPRITRSNIVCAEPMPGEKDLLREFTATLEVPALGYLVEQVFDKMQLAGEAGSLLKIEEEIRDIIIAAKRLWKAEPKIIQLQMFDDSYEQPEQLDLPLNFTGITDGLFWDGAEGKLYQALQKYSEITGEHGYQRRLFADDAARGFAYIDICRKKYDIVLMNPPFGLAPRRVFEIHKKKYADSYVEMYAQMVTRGIEVLNTNGFIGAISSRSFMTISRLRKYRQNIILPGIFLLADLGASVMDDAFVESIAYIISRQFRKQILAIDLRDIVEPEMKLANSIEYIEKGNSNWIIKDRQLIRKLPDNKLLYSIPLRVHTLLDNKNVLEPSIATVRQGMGTFNDFRFLRLRHEVSRTSIHLNGWEPLAKGGPFSFYYSDIHLLLNWENDGSELSALNIANNGQDAQVRQASDFWRRSGSTYSKRSQKGFSARVLPSGCIIAGKGPAILSQSDISNVYLLGWINSYFIRWFIELQANDHEYNTGILKKIPWIEPNECIIDLTERTMDCVRKLQYAHAINENNSYFLPILNNCSIREIIEKWDAINSDAKSNLAKVMTEWDEFIDNLYQVDSKSLKLIDSNDDISEPDDEENTDEVVVSTYSAGSIISILIGFCYGRWNICFVNSNKTDFVLPDPFEPIPICPPGMLQNAKGLPAEPQDVPVGYPLNINWKGILVDDENHTDDLIYRVRKSIELIWKEKASDIEHEMCENLEVKSLREYFNKPSGFFAEHLKHYSKSRRQAPIYWPLSSSKGSYTLWIYYHSLTDQTLHITLADFVDPKIKSIRSEISILRETKTQQARLEELLDLEKEMADFRVEIERIIKLPWKPNLNDGVLITASPLWKLFRLPKWQKDLKDCWESLEKGEFDWAHLAYSIWPKRVEEVCKKDRSMAIAHNLEHLCQVVPPKAKINKKKIVDEDTLL